VRSFKNVKEKISNAQLIIIGTGNQYDKLKRMTDDDPNILMTGFVLDDELVDYLRAANIVVFPSRGENASFTIMEAMACELPVVSSDVGNAECIRGADRRIRLKDYTEEEVAGKIIRVLSDEKLAKKIGKDARDFVVKNHSWGMISEKIEDLYNSVFEDWENKK
jgi:glycosyltransferase involved in cell wall biosynthesis